VGANQPAQTYFYSGRESMPVQKEKQQGKAYGKQSRCCYDHPVDSAIGSH
jgi:hypothetical protein